VGEAPGMVMMVTPLQNVSRFRGHCASETAEEKSGSLGRSGWCEVWQELTPH